MFPKICNRQPNEYEDGLWLFGKEDGDCYDDAVAISGKNGRFEQNYFTDKLLLDAALSEIHRTLAPRGRRYAIESGWADVPTILTVFERSCIRPWDCYQEPRQTRHERLLRSGFMILSEDTYMHRSLSGEDNELGREAEKAGIRAGMRWNAYIPEKP